tara:strand:+ start:227 stop:1048 length:822 start_codon:yes stop_codon:yes gene_type:complete
MTTYKQEYQKRVEKVYGEPFDWGGAAKRLAAGILGAPADGLLLMSYMAYLGDKITVDQLISDFESLEPYTLEGLSEKWGAPDEGLASYADWLTLGLGGTSKLVQKAAKKPMNKAITDHLLKKGGIESPKTQVTPIDLAERRDIALIKKKQKEKVQAKLSDEDLYDRRTDHQDDQYMFDYTEEDMLEDKARRAWEADYNSDPNVIEGKKMAEFTVRRREQELQKITPKAKSFDDMTDEEMFEQMGGLDDMDYASPVQEIIPQSSKKIIQFQPRG